MSSHGTGSTGAASAAHSSAPAPASSAKAGLGELAKSYSPKETESAVGEVWRSANAFRAEPAGIGPRGNAEPYCIFIPPPNVTAALHLGHALNNTLQDVLTRAHRMMGQNTLWMPGTDHAGIATQTVVEKRLLQQGKRRTDFTREEFIAKVQEWKDEYEATIISQLEAMGSSCDFSRTRFTMDPVCAAAVREAFFRLFKDGLIYRGYRLVNWDPVSRTALADDEVEMEEVKGHMWYLRYPLEDGSGHVTVATTRPETMLGDSAVAMNPKDPRAAALRGKRVKLPIVGRVIPIVEDDYVVLPAELAQQVGADASDPKAAFATGFLKVTPAHDPNDWEIGQRHGLKAINVMAEDATISDRHGWEDVSDEARAFLGLSREEARKRIVQWFRDAGLLEKAREYDHSVGHSYRSHVPIEPYLSEQWYVKVTDDRLAGAAIRAMAPDQVDGAPAALQRGGPASGDGELRFWPERYAKTFQMWHENIRDWCISRQLWWGHRIPVWVAPESAAQHAVLAPFVKSGRVSEMVHSGKRFVCVRREGDREAIQSLEANGFTQDSDVLDTWFSSALWPLSTLGWPDPAAAGLEPNLLATFNPSDVLCTAREIITLWVSRMVMFNRYFTPDHHLPFRDVFIHAMIQDGYGQKMSKSLGNGVDPRDIIHSHGADAMRFTLVQMTTNTQDVRMPVDMIDPHSGEVFAPATIRTSAGHTVADATQVSPKDPSKRMVSGYGFASGVATPTDAMPLARNTSSKFDLGRNFCNKLWNATRFALSNLSAGVGDPVPVSELPLVDRWIIARLHRTMHTVEDALASYRFNEYAEALYDFVWRDFCDWYLEAIKPTVKQDARQRRTLRTVLDASLRMLHPICPFVTETLWPHVQATGEAGLPGIKLPPSATLALADWPSIACSVEDESAAALFERTQAIVNAIRNKRGERQVQPKKRIRLQAPSEILALVQASEGIVESLCGLESVGELVPGSAPPADGVPFAFEGREVVLSGLVDAVDVGAERIRLEKTIADRERQISGFRGKLDNAGYIAKAKPELVEETKAKLAEAEADLAAARRLLAALA
ncbi:MAG: valine--tRNA ligase [Phycisphaerae bacterium]|nr:valine--tRNA ligase [Phycisphaerae bacterium]